jgi:hypothetical protein
MSEITVLKTGLLIESNGAYVLDFKQGSYPNTSVVICFWPSNVHHPFIVWTYNEISGFCENGNYYANIQDALVKFNERGF